MSHIHIHRKKATERNDYTIVVVYYDSESYGTWQRTMRHKGINPSWIASRLMTHDELADHKEQTRLRWTSYQKWDDLIQDEWSITSDREWCERLHELSKLGETLNEIIGRIETPHTTV